MDLLCKDEFVSIFRLFEYELAYFDLKANLKYDLTKM